MPIYTYRCENCGIQFDKHQRFSDQPLKDCPECNHRALRKVYQPVGIVFKGSGFYATDNRSPSGMDRKKKESQVSEKKEKTEAPDKPEKKEQKKSD